jgi:hypothetical protein
MKRLILLLILLLVPGNLFATTPVIKGVDMLKIVKKDLVQAGQWKRTPTVVICEHAPAAKEDIFFITAYIYGDLGHRKYVTAQIRQAILPSTL